jgi:hypothetical protein
VRQTRHVDQPIPVETPLQDDGLTPAGPGFATISENAPEIPGFSRLIEIFFAKFSET